MWEWWNVFDVKDLIDRIKGEEEEEEKRKYSPLMVQKKLVSIPFRVKNKRET